MKSFHQIAIWKCLPLKEKKKNSHFSDVNSLLAFNNNDDD